MSNNIDYRTSISKKIRPSPMTSASIYGIGTKKTGNDGNIWTVAFPNDKKTKIKQWKLLSRSKVKSKIKTKVKAKTKSKSETKSKGDKGKSDKSKKINQVLNFYDTIYIGMTDFKNMMNIFKSNEISTLNNIFILIDILRKKGIIAHIIPLTLSKDGFYWGDYPKDYMNEIYGDKWYDNKNGHMYFVVYMNQAGTELDPNKGINVSYSEMNKKQKIEIIKLLDNYVPKQYVWSGKNTQTIVIYYDQVKNFNKIDIDKLKDDDVYPMMRIIIFFNKTINLFDDENKSIVYEIMDNLKKNIVIDITDSIDFSYGKFDAIYDVFSISKDDYEKSLNGINKFLSSKKNLIEKYEIKYVVK